MLTVTDTGTGIAPAELSGLFERFRRVRGARSRTHEGSGIGLALVQELVRLHGGSVEVGERGRRGLDVHRPRPARRRRHRRRGGRAHERRRGLPRGGPALAAGGRGLGRGAGRRRRRAPGRRRRPGRARQDPHRRRQRRPARLPRAAARAPLGRRGRRRRPCRPDRGRGAPPGPDPLRRDDARARRLRPARGAPRRPVHVAAAGDHALRAGRRGGRASRASPPAPTTTSSSRSPRASCSPACGRTLDLAELRQAAAAATERHARLLRDLADAAVAINRAAHRRGGARGRGRARPRARRRRAGAGATSSAHGAARRRRRRADTRARAAHRLRGARALGELLLARRGGHRGVEAEAVLTQLAQLASTRLENALLYEREHRVAETLQRSLLPESLPELAGAELAALYLPGSSEATRRRRLVRRVRARGRRRSRSSSATWSAAASRPPPPMGQLRNAVRAYLLEGYGPARDARPRQPAARRRWAAASPRCLPVRRPRARARCATPTPGIRRR